MHDNKNQLSLNRNFTIDNIAQSLAISSTIFLGRSNKLLNGYFYYSRVHPEDERSRRRRSSTTVLISVEGTNCVGSYTTDFNSFFLTRKHVLAGGTKTTEPSVHTNQNQNNQITGPGAAAHGTSSHRSWHRTRIDISPPQEIKSIRCCCCCVRWRWSGSCALKQQQHPSVNERERPCQNARFAFAFKLITLNNQLARIIKWQWQKSVTCIWNGFNIRSRQHHHINSEHVKCRSRQRHNNQQEK